MTDAHIDLAWWPPAPDERIGEERAQELLEALKRVAGPVVDDAEADLRQRANPGTEIVRSASPATYTARFHVDDPHVRSLCVGVVYEEHAGDAQQNAIQLHRDGVLRWRRD
jgi:hypothetical protein